MFMEYFDVLDENRNSLGYQKYRGEIMNDNEYWFGSEIWIINNNKLLITQRALNKTHPNKWEVPGGCSKSGETSTDTVIRETKEEIGININNYKLINTVLYKNQFVDMYLSTMPVDLNKTKLQEDEVSDIKFVTKDEFLEMNKKGQIVESVFNRYKTIEEKIKEFK